MRGFRPDGPCLVMANVQDPPSVRKLVERVNATLMESGYAPTPELASALLNLALIHCLSHHVSPKEVIAGVGVWFQQHAQGGN